MDEDNDDGLGGRTRYRREVSAGNRWSLPLCALDVVQIEYSPMPQHLREAVLLGRSITSYRGRNRQYQRIDKLVRELEDEEIAAIDAFIRNPTVAFAELDRWCDRLVADGDDALDQWIAEHPGSDRQRLRTLVRNVRSKVKGARDVLRTALAETLPS